MNLVLEGFNCKRSDEKALARSLKQEEIATDGLNYTGQ